LLLGLLELASEQGFTVVAAHLDHGMDPESAARAEAAEEMARCLKVPLRADRRPVTAGRGESPEAAARRIRYAFLAEVREAVGARWIATAHHAEDQAETVLLRLRQGSGLEGLAGIQPVWGRVVRPLLHCRRGHLEAALQESPRWTSLGWTPLEDPGNRDLRQPRSLMRHGVLPRLARRDPKIATQLAQLAESARRGRRSLEARLERILKPRPVYAGVGVEAKSFAALPSSLQPAALAFLHRQLGAPYPAGRKARREFLRQWARLERDPGARLGCDSGADQRWEREGDLLVLRRVQAPPAFFTYTFGIPGSREIPELSVRITVRPAEGDEAVRRWEPTTLPPESRPRLRAALALTAAAGETVIVRNRRPGDRIRLPGSRSERRLKEVLIDRKVPRCRRDRLPLLEVAGRLAWVPGVTLGATFEVTDPRNAWIAQIEPI
jgi:tRNA(Ile)-lysidine synthase